MATDIAGTPFDNLLKAVSDPKQRAALIDRAAQEGPPPPIRPDFPLVPGTPVQAPGFITPQLAGGPIAGGPVQGRKPATPEEVEVNRSAWDEFITKLTDPNGPALALLQFGAQALQPRDPRVSDAAAVIGALAQSVEALRQRQAAGREEALRERQLNLKEDVAGAQIRASDAAAGVAGAREGLLGAQTEAVRRGVASAGITDDLKKAQAELARAQAEALQNPKGSASAQVEALRQQVDLQQARMMAELFPEQYPSVEHALVAWRKFKVDKGKIPAADLIFSGMQILPYMDPQSEEYRNTFDTVQRLMVEVGKTLPPEGQGPGGRPEGNEFGPRENTADLAILQEQAKTDPKALEDLLVLYYGYPRGRARAAAQQQFAGR